MRTAKDFPSIKHSILDYEEWVFGKAFFLLPSFAYLLLLNSFLCFPFFLHLVIHLFVFQSSMNSFLLLCSGSWSRPLFQCHVSLAVRTISSKSPESRTEEDVRIIYRVLNSLRSFKERFTESMKQKISQCARYQRSVRADHADDTWGGGGLWFFPLCKLFFSLLTRTNLFFPLRQRSKQNFFPI